MRLYCISNCQELQIHAQYTILACLYKHIYYLQVEMGKGETCCKGVVIKIHVVKFSSCWVLNFFNFFFKFLCFNLSEMDYGLNNGLCWFNIRFVDDIHFCIINILSSKYSNLYVMPDFHIMHVYYI